MRDGPEFRPVLDEEDRRGYAREAVAFFFAIVVLLIAIWFALPGFIVWLRS